MPGVPTSAELPDRLATTLNHDADQVIYLFWCVLVNGAILRHVKSVQRLEPTEQTAAVVTGWAVTWGLTTFEIPAMPAILIGLVVWATVSGRYRSRWNNTPRDGFQAEPGS